MCQLMHVHTYMYAVDVSDGKLNVFSQVTEWQIGHTGAEDWTDKGLFI